MIILIRAKELETVLNNEEQGMVVPITRWVILKTGDGDGPKSEKKTLLLNMITDH